MTKHEFLESLSQELRRNNVADATDIIEEYEQHFSFKLADGCSEEEISAKLGDPKTVAEQYYTPSTEPKGGKRMVSMLGLGTADFFFGILWMILCAWEIVMIAFTVASGALSACLVCQVDLPSVPDLPLHCALLLGAASAALAVLSAAGTICFCGSIRMATHRFSHFHKSTIASAMGRANIESSPSCPQFTEKTGRTIRKITEVSAIIFAICLIAGFTACVVSAGAFEFWHVWGWFGYGK